jgi:peptidoglycan/xylan/chitin deacetylase (PgdA/CDA1 family)
MVRIFTYHEVRECVDGVEPNFYTVSPGRFSAQLETFNNRGWTSLKLEEVTQSPADTNYVLTFDDATRDHHEIVLPLLEKNRCHASFYVPTAKLNQPGFMANSQVREIAAAGHEIGSHSHEHQRMDLMSEEEVRSQISHSIEIIADITGSKPRTFVPPGGFMNETIRKVAAEFGMKALRTMRWGYNLKMDLLALETVPLNRYTDQQKFLAALEPRGPSLVYAGKEALKRIVPLRTYERLRGMVFKLKK